MIPLYLCLLKSYNDCQVPTNNTKLKVLRLVLLLFSFLLNGIIRQTCFSKFKTLAVPRISVCLPLIFQDQIADSETFAVSRKTKSINFKFQSLFVSGIRAASSTTPGTKRAAVVQAVEQVQAPAEKHVVHPDTDPQVVRKPQQQPQQPRQLM